MSDTRPPTGTITEGNWRGSGYCDTCQAMGDPKDADWLDKHLASDGHQWRPPGSPAGGA